MKVKNTKGSSDTWVGQQIAAGAYYTIQGVELSRWQNDDKVLTDLGSGDLLLNDETEDISNVGDAINILKGIDTSPKDSDGSPLSRIKVTTTGWHYRLHGLEFTTAKKDSVVEKKANGDNFGFTTMKFYDADDNELTTQVNIDLYCVKTVVDWEPTHDFEIVGGMFRQSAVPTNAMRLWVVGVPDVPEAYGGSKEFATNVNLQFLGLEEGIRVDGRAPKYMSYNATYHTNKIRMILKHNAGVQHEMHMTFEIFKA